MTHSMKLRKEPFEQILSGIKGYEFRLNDEKRSLVSEGDIIIFTCEERNAAVKVRGIIKAPSWKELEKRLNGDKTAINTTLDSVMSEYYIRSDEEKYGCIAIEIELINS